MSDTRICRECGLEAYWHATAYERKDHPDACNVLRSAVVGKIRTDVDLGLAPHAIDSELAQDLYPIFVALVDWLRKAGRTETNARRGAYAALRTIGVHPDIRVLIMRRYIAGARATAELDHEGRR